MRGRILRWFIGLVILVLIAMRFSVFIVREGEVAVVERFGKVRRIILQPGCYSKWFWPMERAHRFDDRRRAFRPAYVETLTRDQRNIIVWSYVVWSIDDGIEGRAADDARPRPDVWSIEDGLDTPRVKTFVESVRATEVGPQRAIEVAEYHLNNIILDAQNAILGSYDHSALVSTDAAERRIEQIEADVVRAAEPKCREYGIRVHQFGLMRLALPESTVKEALGQMGARRLIVANQYLAEGGMAAARIRSDTDLEAARTIAEANRRAEEIRGSSQADEARTLMEAHQEDPDFFTWLRSLEALRRMMSDQTMLILNTTSPPLDVLKQPAGPRVQPSPTPPSGEAAAAPAAGGLP